ncbi:UNVERIFIED_CONTAM: hypothetical protein K2H54_059770, partial [Gekko kuhli]
MLRIDIVINKVNKYGIQFYIVLGSCTDGAYRMAFSLDASVLGLADPKLCYVLDGILFIYAIIITAFFVKEK